jgi:hypothetical protein
VLRNRGKAFPKKKKYDLNFEVINWKEFVVTKFMFHSVRSSDMGQEHV